MGKSINDGSKDRLCFIGKKDIWNEKAETFETEKGEEKSRQSRNMILQLYSIKACVQMCKTYVLYSWQTCRTATV